MEKKLSLTRNELIKWIVLFATVLSAFLANQYDIRNLKRESEEMKQEIKELRKCQSDAAVEVANMNGKLDEINANVTVIKEAIIKRGVGFGN